MGKWMRAAAVMTAAAMCVCAAAQEKTFDFKDPKGVNAIGLELDSPLEPFHGTASGISGTVKFDPAAPAKLSGVLKAEAKSIQFTNKGMTDTLHGSDWLDVGKHKEVTFAFREVKEAKKLGENAHELTVAGEVTCKGITKPVTVTVRADYLPGKLGSRVRGKEGDLLVLRSDFSIRRADFDLKPEMGGDVVAEEIRIRAAIVGHSEK